MNRRVESRSWAAPLKLTVEALSPKVMRIRIGAAAASAPSYLPVKDWPEASTTLDRDCVRSAALGVRLLPKDEVLEFSDREGRPRLRFDLAAIEAGARLRLRFEIVGEQHFYGLGQGGQPLDRLGATRRLWNCHVNHGPGGDIGIPLLLSQLGYGLFFDNPRLAFVDAGKSHDRVCFDYECEAGGFDLYFLGGDDLRDVLRTSAELLGHAPMPPRWALGYMQSTRAFRRAGGGARARENAPRKALPCDALIFLSTYCDGKGWNRAVGSLDYEPTVFPIRPRRSRRFREQGSASSPTNIR